MKVLTFDTYVRVEIEKEEIFKIDFDLAAQPRETLGSYYNRQPRKPEFLINGGFFNMSSGETCFSFIDDDEIIKNHYGVKDGIGLLKDDLTDLKYGNIDDGTNWWDFMAGYPVIVKDGTAITSFTWASEINYNAVRSAMGFTKTGKVVFIGVNKPGVNLATLAALMVQADCEYAINLDGGGSSRLLVKGEVVNKPTENRSVDSVVAVYLKTPEECAAETEFQPYIEYTVQKGDSLWKIAAEYLDSGIRYKEIVEFNDLGTNTLYVGQVLKIPVDCEKYVVKSGDTLWKISAEKLGSGAKYKYLMEFNNMTSSTLSVGQVIYIPV